MTMQDLLKLFVQMDPAAQVAIMAVIAGGVVAALRAFGLKCKPGLASVLVAVGVGALTGYAANGWQGALLGALAGLAATGGHQVAKQTSKFPEDWWMGEVRAVERDAP